MFDKNIGKYDYHMLYPTALYVSIIIFFFFVLEWCLLKW